MREPGSTVRGEVYAVDASTLQNLDELEDNGRLYRRELLPVVLEERGETLRAWVYLWLRGVRPEKAVPPERQPWRP